MRAVGGGLRGGDGSLWRGRVLGLRRLGLRLGLRSGTEYRVNLVGPFALAPLACYDARQMRIEADAVIRHPRARVYAAYRDELLWVVEQLPRVKEIVVQERRQQGSIVHLVNLWKGSAAVPAAAEKVLPSTVSWQDHAVWDESLWSCRWHIDSQVFPEAVRCSGENTFVDLGDRTRVEIRGEIHIDLGRVRVVPDLVASPIASAVERFLVRQITPNLVTVGEALDEYLSRTPAAPPPTIPTAPSDMPKPMGG